MKVNGEICTIIGIIIVISSVSTYEKVSSERYIMISNTPPVASFNFSPFMPSPNESIAFNSTSYDIDGYITNYTWNFGDGSYAYGKNVVHKYGKKGSYIAILTVTDNDGAIDSYELVLNVKEKEKTPGFGLAIIILATALLIFMKKYKIGI